MAPTLTAAAAGPAREGHPFVLNLSHADPGDDPVTWSIDWGDGSPLETATGETAALVHQYNAASGASFTPTLTATPADAPPGTTPSPIAVSVPPLTAAAPPRQHYLPRDPHATTNFEVLFTYGGLGLRPEYLNTPLLTDTPEDAVRQALYTINQQSSEHPPDAMHVYRADDVEYDVKFPDALNAGIGSGSPAMRISGVSYSTTYQEHTATIDLYGPDGQLDFRWYARVPALPTVYAVATQPGSEDAQTPGTSSASQPGEESHHPVAPAARSQQDDQGGVDQCPQLA